MKKLNITLLLTISVVFFAKGQELTTISNTKKNYKIDIPKNWEVLQGFDMSSVSFMASKPEAKEDPNPQEAIIIKHVPNKKKTIVEGYNEYIGLLTG